MLEAGGDRKHPTTAQLPARIGKVLRTIRFSKSVRDKKKIPAALRLVKTMANALLRECTRKRPEYCRVVNQERLDKNKIDSLHEPWRVSAKARLTKNTDLEPKPLLS